MIGPRTRAALVLVAMFLLGGVAGAGFQRWRIEREFHAALHGPPGEARIRFRLHAMRRHLDLSEEQAKKIEAILIDADRDHAQAVAPCRSALDQLHEKIDKRIDEVLTPEQRKKRDEARARFRDIAGPPGPPGPP